MSNFLEEIEDELVLQNLVGGDTGWKLYKSDLPPQPDKAVAIIESTSLPPETTSAIDYRNFTVLVRGLSDGYVEAQAKAQAIYNGLHAADLGTKWVYCYASSAVLPLGKDETSRPIFSINFRTMRNSDVS